MGNSDLNKLRSGWRKMIRAGRFLVLLAIVIVVANISRSLMAGSIFDDDFTPAAPAKPRQQPAPSVVPEPAPPPTPAPQPAPTHPQPKPEPSPIPAPVTPPPVATHHRLPIPPKEDLQKSRNLFKEVFAKELSDATLQGHRALAARLLQESQKVDDIPTDQFVLLGGAIQAAQLGAQLAPCLEAAGAMGAKFEVDPLQTKVNVALSISFQTSPVAITIENCQRGLELATELATAGDYETAKKLLTAMRSAAAVDPAIRQNVQDRLKELDAAMKTAAELAPALTKIKTAPDDPAANLTIGENLCFVQDNWTQGLPHLVKGNDAELKALAARDLATPAAPADMAALGNDWWDAAAKREGAVKNGMRIRAYTWFSACVSQLTGLQKIVVAKRMAESPFLGTHVGPIGEIKTNLGHILRVAFAPDGHSALSSHENGTIALWDLLAGDLVREFHGHTGHPYCLSAPAVGHVFISSGTNDHTVRLWDLDSGKELHSYGFGKDTWSACISPDDSKVIYGSNGAGPFAASTATFQNLPMHGEGTYSSAWSPGGRYCATGGWGQVVHVYDSHSLREVAGLKQHGHVYAIAFTPDERKVISTGDNHLFVFDLQTRQKLFEFEAVGGTRTIAVTADSRYVLAPNEGQKLFFWDLTTGKPSDRFEAEQPKVTSVAISRDGKIALSGDADGSIRIWRLPMGL